ncbi:MAG: DUF1934 family protein [bacterium]|nr:DUF1934 family protein [bacterium]
MKRSVHVTIESRQLEPGGTTLSHHQRGEGTWYDEPARTTLVWREGAIQHTIRIEGETWRVYRRGEGVDGWHEFEVGVARRGQLGLSGQAMRFATHARRLARIDDGRSTELHMEYSLYAEDSDLGAFTLIIRIDPVSEDTTP